MTRLPTEEFAAFLGIDWADAKHDICLQAAGAEKRECCVLDHHPDTLDEWVSTVRTRCKGQPMAICLARKKGPLVSARRQHDLLGALSRASTHAGALARGLHPQQDQG